MKLEIIKNALENALNLISEEYQNLEDEFLQEDYQQVIDELEMALKEFES